MKKIFAIFAVLMIMAISAPMAQAGTSPRTFAMFYQNTIMPGDGYNAVAPSKSGTSTCRNIFGFVATGNCSVREAMRVGGISQLAYYDVQTRNILGYMTIIIKAYGK